MPESALIVAAREAAAEQVRGCDEDDRITAESMLRAFDRVVWIIRQHDRLLAIETKAVERA